MTGEIREWKPEGGGVELQVAQAGAMEDMPLRPFVDIDLFSGDASACLSPAQAREVAAWIVKVADEIDGDV